MKNAKLDNKIHKLTIIHAPVNHIINKLKLKGFFHPTKHRFNSNRFMAFFKDHRIVRCYGQIIHTLLNYYAPCANSLNVKTIAFQLKLGCIRTLAHKHNKSTQWIYLNFGKNCTVLNGYKKILAELPSDRFINEKSTKYQKLATKLNINLELSNIFKKYNFRVYKTNIFNRLYSRKT